MDDFWNILSHTVTFITACKYGWSAFKYIRKIFKSTHKFPRRKK